MRHVIVEWRDDEYTASSWLDPQSYLDVLPVLSAGCTHEIRFTCGSLLVSCADLDARWRAVSG